MSEFRRRLMMQVNSKPPIPTKNGVYIQAINGRFYTKEEWSLPNEQANGVAVIDSRHPNKGFVIALKENGNRQMWSKSGVFGFVTGVTATDTYSKAITDYKGAENSAAIVSRYGNTTNYAAGWCQNYSFKNGQKGYLGSRGEWEIAYSNKTEINDCLTLVRGTKISSDNEHYYWTSTQYNDMNAWVEFWLNNLVKNDIPKNDTYFARAFTTLSLL